MRFNLEKDYLGDFTATEKAKLLYRLAKQYHETCEAYDREVCSYISEVSGNALPTSPSEYRLINKHAREVLENILLSNPSVDRKELRRVISNSTY